MSNQIDQASHTNQANPLVGPPVPDHIKAIRQSRLKKSQEEETKVNKADSNTDNINSSTVKENSGDTNDNNANNKDTSNNDNESESEDELLGPQLPTQSLDDTQDAEAAALERLKSRSKETNNTQKKESSADRANWMAYALGQKVDNNNDKNVTYNPKTLRRNVAMGGAQESKGVSETETERAKRLADEMMGLGESENSSKKTKTETQAETKEDSEDEEYFSVRRNQPSLLEQHLQNKDKTKTSSKKGKKGKGGNDKFDWNRDMKGTGLGSRKVQEIVNQAKGMGSRFARSTQ